MKLVDNLWGQLAELATQEAELREARDLDGLERIANLRRDILQALRGIPNDIVWELIRKIGEGLTKVAATSHNRGIVIDLSEALVEIADLVRKGSELGEETSVPGPTTTAPANGLAAPAPLRDGVRVIGWTSREHLHVAQAAFGTEPLTLDVTELVRRTGMTREALEAALEGMKAVMLTLDEGLGQGCELNIETAAIVGRLKRKWSARTLAEIFDIVKETKPPVRR